MRAMIPAAVLAAVSALLMAPAVASAQASKAYDYAPTVVDGPKPQAARPYGATYIPGIGFRYIAPGGPRVYSYYRARGYRDYRSVDRCRSDWWFFRDRCRHWR
jgi:hypothetical protein